MSTITTYYRDDEEIELSQQLKYTKFEMVKPGVALMTMIRPKEMNTINSPVVWELNVCIEHAKRCDEIKALVWTSTGRAFSAGFDLGQKSRHTIPIEVRRGYQKRGYNDSSTDVAMSAFVMNAYRFPKPFIFAVNGIGVGGGANLPLMLGDIIIASERAKFRWPFVDVGITPEVGSTFLLPKKIGLSAAKKYLMLGEWMTAKEAFDYGLVQYVVPHKDFLQTAILKASQLAQHPNQFALLKQKELLHAPILKALEEATSRERVACQQSVTHPDFAASIKRITAEIMKKKLKKRKSKPKL